MITPEGKIRRKNPLTGEDEEVDDIPANRNVLPPTNAPGPMPEQLRVSIVEFMESRGIDSAEKFKALTDEELLKIPGMHPHAVPHLRRNVLSFLERQQALAEAATTPEAKLSTGATDGETSVVMGDTVSNPTKIEPPKKAKSRKPKTLGERVVKDPPVNLKRQK